MPALQPAIGLEVHVQLSTRTKMFCACRADYAGEAPNCLTCPVCLGLPGALPVLNGEVVRRAVRVVRALGGEVLPVSHFDRKNYFYPDLPRGYQITQYHHPIGRGGELGVEDEEGRVRPVPIRRVHMEEDAGRLLHDPDGAGCRVDLNRAGVPLLEIVSEPTVRTPAEAHAFLVELATLLAYLEVGDGRMEDGSLRCDANVSVGPAGGALGTRVEIKNLNSFRHVERALAFEVERQRARRSAGEEVAAETRAWDAAGGRTVPLRGKEESPDYRYFPEPDLPPVMLEPGAVEREEARLPQLPATRRERYRRRYGLSVYDARVLVADPARARLFEDALAAAAAPAKALSNWITTEVAGRMAGRARGPLPFGGAALGALVAMVEHGILNGAQAKRVLDRMMETGRGPEELRAELGLENLTDEGSIRELCAGAIREHPDAAASYRGGRWGALGFLVGRVMVASRGAADPRRASAELKELLEA